MRGADLVEAMASAVDRIVSACEGAGALDRAFEAVVGMIGRFSGKNATSYLEAYRAKMVMRDILEDRRLSGFPRVVVPGIHAEVLEVREECGTWEEFEGWLLEKYGVALIRAYGRLIGRDHGGLGPRTTKNRGNAR
jgi:hypothetical protein